MIDRLWRLFKVRRGWELRPPSEFCESGYCHLEEPLMPTAYNDAGEWILHWYCDACGMTPLDNDHMIDWPMRRNYATAQDLKRLGFSIV